MKILLGWEYIPPVFPKSVEGVDLNGDAKSMGNGSVEAAESGGFAGVRKLGKAERVMELRGV